MSYSCDEDVASYSSDPDSVSLQRSGGDDEPLIEDFDVDVWAEAEPSPTLPAAAENLGALTLNQRLHTELRRSCELYYAAHPDKSTRPNYVRTFHGIVDNENAPLLVCQRLRDILLASWRVPPSWEAGKKFRAIIEPTVVLCTIVFEYILAEYGKNENATDPQLVAQLFYYAPKQLTTNSVIETNYNKLLNRLSSHVTNSAYHFTTPSILAGTLSYLNAHPPIPDSISVRLRTAIAQLEATIQALQHTLSLRFCLPAVQTHVAATTSILNATMSDLTHTLCTVEVGGEAALRAVEWVVRAHHIDLSDTPGNTDEKSQSSPLPTTPPASRPGANRSSSAPPTPMAPAHHARTPSKKRELEAERAEGYTPSKRGDCGSGSNSTSTNTYRGGYRGRNYDPHYRGRGRGYGFRGGSGYRGGSIYRGGFRGFSGWKGANSGWSPY